MSDIKTFKGFKQVTLQSYLNDYTDEERKGYLWLVNEYTDTGNTEIKSSSIYFGNRIYAENTNLTLKDAGIIDASGNVLNIIDIIEDNELVTAESLNDLNNKIENLSGSSGSIKEVNGYTTSSVTLDSADIATDSDIIIEGGPLATLAKQAYTGGTLPSGTSLQEFLQSMLCVEKWSSTPKQTNTFSTSLNAPTITLTYSGKTVEVGTQVTLSDVKPNNSTATQKINVKTMTYGYKNGESGTYTSSTEYNKSLTPTSGGSRTIKVDYGAFKHFVGGTVSSIDPITSGDTIASDSNLYVTEGKNTITTYQSGYTYTADTSYEGETLYIATNLKNYYKEDKATDNTVNVTNPWTTTSAITATASTASTVTGARAYFYGWMEEGKAVASASFTSDLIRGLQSSGLTIASNTYNLTNTTSASQFIFAFPTSAGKSITKVNDGGALDADITGNFTKTTVTVSSANNFDSISYDVWEYTPVGNAWDPRTLKITIA